ncbi:RimK/LysX family protein [Nanoarchaeota archaeon]
MEDKTILGLSETVMIFGNNHQRKEVMARIDTGATNSSIDASIARLLELGPVKRTKLVKSASGKGRRAIIAVKVKLDNKILEDDFTIAERKHMTYPVLIGQNILKKGNFLIDPNKK